MKANTIVNKYTDFLASVGKEGKKSIMGGDSLFSRLEMWKIVVIVREINYPSAISFTLDFPDSRCGKKVSLVKKYLSLCYCRSNRVNASTRKWLPIQKQRDKGML